MKKFILTLISAALFSAPLAYAADNMDQSMNTDQTAATQQQDTSKSMKHEGKKKKCTCNCSKHSKKAHKDKDKNKAKSTTESTSDSTTSSTTDSTAQPAS